MQIKKTEIVENLKALVYKGNLTAYQRALAQREFKDLLERLELFERSVKNCNTHDVSVSVCNHKGTTIAWGPDADKCTNCEEVWDV